MRRRFSIWMAAVVIVVFGGCEDSTGATCPEGQALCEGLCETLGTDPLNCGACGNVCDTDAQCVNGSCMNRCDDGEELCSTGCADLMTDSRHCGACGNACDTDFACVAGQCIDGCEGTQILCGDTCADLMVDNAHCGECGNACEDYALCDAGQCVPQCGAENYTQDTDCGECLLTGCCAELFGCDTGTDCATLHDCLEACQSGDSACQEVCITDYPDGLVDLQALYACRDEACPAACAAPGLCGTELTYGSVELNQCIEEQCCSSFTPCAEDPVCLDCLMDPETTGCDTNVFYAVYVSCQQGSCAGL